MIPKIYLGAFKIGHRRTSREFIDDAFADELLKKVQKDNCPKAKEALEFLTKFNNEFHKNVVKKGDKKALHSKEEHRIDCSRRDNARNRDVFVRHERSTTFEGSYYFCDPPDQEPESDF